MKKILIIDDSISILIALKRRLSFLYEIETSESGKHALKIIDNSFNVVITDMKMPDINGIELIKIMYKKFPNIRFVVLSGNEPEEEALKMKQAGIIDAFLEKPCKINELKKIIDK
jgi:DNA-binding NtrC family response regulator